MAGPSQAVAEADGIGTTEAQRVDAAAVVHLDPTPDVLLLSDYDFIHALWQKARDGGEKLEAVRTAAEQAMASTSADAHVLFITTGIHQAYEIDKQREKDRADADRAARLAKSQALMAVGIPNNPDLLALSDDNFIRAVMKHDAAGPEVKAAAALALAGSPAAWREFITNGAREAHQRDVANELKELEKKSREEAEHRRELAARTDTAALFHLTPSAAMLNLGDDNFIRELLRGSSEDMRSSELYLAGQRALLSSDPADWKQFIHTGAEQAYKRDDEIRRQKIADNNRRLALRIQAAAESSGVNPGLAAAAKAALAGSDEDVARFLREDSQYRAKRQSLQMAGPEMAGWYIRQSSPDGGAAFVAPANEKSKQADREDATWVIVPALANQPGCFSFESVRKAGYYLTVQPDRRVRISPEDGSAESRRRATWCAGGNVPGLGVTIQSASQPGGGLQSVRGELYANGPANSVKAAAWQQFWRISPPLAP